MIFYWKAKGTAHDHYNVGKFEADDEKAAAEWVDKTFGILRDDSGKQTNSDLVKASVIDKTEYDSTKKENDAANKKVLEAAPANPADNGTES